MAQAVTELVVRGDGALAVLDRFERGMEDAGTATDRTTGAVADFERRMEAARVAIERGNAITTQSIERKTAEQRAWDKWSATVDRAQALRIRLEREAAQAAVAATNAVNLGYASQEQALATLIALEQRHAAQLREVVGDHQRVTQAARGAVVANDNLAQSMNRVSAANDNAMGSTANIAAQFQDIGVTAAMGMNPIMIALQQGTQLSAVLNTMQNPIRGLASAFMSIINPVSLLTIGFVTLGAAAIQWFMSAEKGADDASKALEAHDKWLDQILVGYGGVREAARLAGEEARKLPQAEVDLALSRDLVTKQDAYTAALARVQKQMLDTASGQAALSALYIEGGNAALVQRDTLLQIQSAAMKATPDLDAVILSLKSFIQNNPSSVILHVAQAMLDNASAARDAKGAYDQAAAAASATKTSQDQLAQSARGSAAGILQSVNAAWQAVQSYGVAAGAAINYANAMRQLGALIPEVAAAQAQMDSLKVAQDSYNEAISSNRTLLREQAISQTEFTDRQAEAATLYQRATDQVTGLTDATKALADAERSANIGAMQPRDAAIARIRDQYAELTTALTKSGAGPDAFARATAAMEQEVATSNASFDAMAAKASGAGATLKAAARDVEKLAEAYSKTVAGAEKFIAEQENERRTLGMAEESANALTYAFDLLNQAKEAGIALTAPQVAELTNLGREMAAAEAETVRLTRAFEDQKQVVDDVLGTIGDTFKGLFDGTIKDFDGFISHMMEGFAKLGQGNLDKLFSSDGLGSLLSPAGNGNAGGSNGVPVEITNPADISKKFGEIFKGAGGLGGMASAGLGGLGIGYQSQNPIMGGLGGALSGFAAGGPIGGIIGGIAGIIGGLFGMNEALEKAKKKLEEIRPQVEKFIAAANGDVISQYASALADATTQAKQMIEVANQAQDWTTANQIEIALERLPQTLAREFQKDLEASLNSLNGADYLNEIATAQDRYNARLADAKKLGVDGGMALTEFNLSLQKIAADSELTGDQLAHLASVFPQFAHMFKATQALLSTGDMQAEISQAMAQVEQDRSNLLSAYKAEADAIRGVISRAEQLVRSFRDMRSSMLLSASSPLGQEAQVQEALRQFRDTAAKAAAGDQDALDGLTSVGQSALDEAREYYASSEQYAAIWEEVDRTLASTQSVAERQLSEAQQHLVALDLQVGALVDIREGVFSVRDAIAALNSSQSVAQNVQQSSLDKLYQSVFGRNADAPGAAHWAQSGKTLDQIYQDLLFAKQHGAMAMGGIVGSYAGGGIVGNGMWNVDSVLARYANGGNIALAGGEHVTRATSVNSATMPVLSHINRTGSAPGNDNREVVAELRAVRSELAGVKAELSRQTGMVLLSDHETRKTINATNVDTADLVGELKRANSR